MKMPTIVGIFILAGKISCSAEMNMKKKFYKLEARSFRIIIIIITIIIIIIIIITIIMIIAITIMIIIIILIIVMIIIIISRLS